VANWPDILHQYPRNFVAEAELQIENALQQTGLLTQWPRNIVRHTRLTAHQTG